MLSSGLAFSACLVVVVDEWMDGWVWEANLCLKTACCWAVSLVPEAEFCSPAVSRQTPYSEQSGVKWSYIPVSGGQWPRAEEFCWKSFSVREKQTQGELVNISVKLYGASLIFALSSSSVKTT